MTLTASVMARSFFGVCRVGRWCRVLPGLRSVRVKGLEPLRLAARDPKSRLATNYNTPAMAAQRYKKNGDCGVVFEADISGPERGPGRSAGVREEP